MPEIEQMLKRVELSSSGLAKGRNLFRTFIDAALDAVFILDQRGKVLELNRAAEAIFGHARETIVGRHISETIIPAPHWSHLKALDASAPTCGQGAPEEEGSEDAPAPSDGSPTPDGDATDTWNERYEFLARRSDGREIPVEATISSFTLAGATLSTVFLRDISRRKASEQRLRAAKEEAEGADAAKSEIIAILSHEIRTPLNGVLGTLSLLQDMRIPPKATELLRTAIRSGEALRIILGDILDFSKMEAGKLDLEKVPFHFGEMVENTAEFWDAQIRLKELGFIHYVASELDRVFLGDAGRISQILNNFLSNALKFTETGLIKLIADTLPACERKGGSDGTVWVKLSVVDTGPGIAEKDFPRVFRDFEQLGHSRSGQCRGTGLGLAITRRLAKLMGGEVGFSSKLGEGSEFWLILPLEPTDAQATTQSDTEATDEQRLVMPDGSRPRLLLAEDNPTNQIVAREFLKRMGCLVDIAANGLEALDAVRRRPFDAVLMDVSMPELDGIQATERIRRLSGKAGRVPIIALTAYATKEDRDRFLASGMQGFVAKPIAKAALFAELHKVLRHEEKALAEPAKPHCPDRSVFRHFDLDAVERLMADFPASVKEAALGSFEDDVSACLRALREAAQSDDFAALEHHTHTLKSVSGSFGARRLMELAAQANELARSGRGAEAAKRIADLTETGEDTLLELPCLRRRLAATAGSVAAHG